MSNFKVSLDWSYTGHTFVYGFLLMVNGNNYGQTWLLYEIEGFWCVVDLDFDLKSG